jgi:hypothetical protein
LNRFRDSGGKGLGDNLGKSNTVYRRRTIPPNRTVDLLTHCLIVWRVSSKEFIIRVLDVFGERIPYDLNSINYVRQIPALWRLRQNDLEFEAYLGYCLKKIKTIN